MLNLKELRDSDFIQCRQQVLRQWPHDLPLTVNAIAEATIAAGAPRYYVSHLHGMRMLCRLRRGEKVGEPGSAVASQWDEILAKVDDLRARNPWLTDDTALARVLAFERASRFFISPAYAVRLAQSITATRRNPARHRHHRPTQ